MNSLKKNQITASTHRLIARIICLLTSLAMETTNAQLPECVSATINAQTYTPTAYQMSFIPPLVTVDSFMQNTDSAGDASLDFFHCGAKTMSIDCPWASVSAPADPSANNFAIKVQTNDLNLVGFQTCNILIGFADPAYTATLTQTITINIRHPCRLANLFLTSSLSPVTISLMGSPSSQFFPPATNDVATAYGIPSLCGTVSYTVTPGAGVPATFTTISFPGTD
jgi:hypothetical protein